MTNRTKEHFKKRQAHALLCGFYFNWPIFGQYSAFLGSLQKIYLLIVSVIKIYLKINLSITLLMQLNQASPIFVMYALG